MTMILLGWMKFEMAAQERRQGWQNAIHVIKTFEDYRRINDAESLWHVLYDEYGANIPQPKSSVKEVQWCTTEAGDKEMKMCTRCGATSCIWTVLGAKFKDKVEIMTFKT